MTARYSRKDAEAAFARLASALGQTWSDQYGNLWNGKAYEPTAVGQLWTTDGTENNAHVGAWTLDYNPIYGGYVIEVIANTGGGVSQPFGSQRHPASEFCAMVRFALDVLLLDLKALAR
jgi:hypothetical protein